MKDPLNYIYYIQSKFKDAVEVLITGEKDVRSRVQKAYYMFWYIQINEYPEDIGKKVESITKILTRLLGREGYILDDNFRKMKNKTASKAPYLGAFVFKYIPSVLRTSSEGKENNFLLLGKGYGGEITTPKARLVKTPFLMN